MKATIVHDVLHQFYKNEKKSLLIILFLSLIINVVQTGGISYLISAIIDGVENRKFTAVNKYYKYFIVLSLVFVATTYVSKHLQINVLTKMVQWMRRELFEFILGANSEEYTQSNVMKYNSPINRISYASYMWANTLLNNSIPAFCFMVIVTLFFFYNSWKLGFMFLVFNLILGLYVRTKWNGMLEKKYEYEQIANDNEEYVIDLFNNLDKIIYRGTMEEEIAQYRVRSDEAVEIGLKYYHNIDKHMFVLLVILYVSVFVYIGMLIHLCRAKELTVKIVITFFTMILLYREHTYNGIQMIPEMLDFQGRNDYILKKFEDIELTYDQKDVPKYTPVSLEFREIMFDHVSFKYKSGDANIVDDLNLVIKTDHRVVGLTGLSGRGKSTLMKMLMRMYSPTSGKILIDGVDIQTVDPTYIRHNITYVNQNSKLFDRKIIENIMYGCIDPDRCEGILREIMLRPKVRDLYKNVNLIEGSSGSLGENLSGGQRQIVNLISGLVNPSKILILDEPTNALDSGLKQEVLKLIKDFSKYKQAVIIITHDRDVYPLFDESIAL
jgi:ABC-type bacteriocin/lantibiotic exporter with double-glycine peptidase domain